MARKNRQSRNRGAAIAQQRVDALQRDAGLPVASSKKREQPETRFISFDVVPRRPAVTPRRGGPIADMISPKALSVAARPAADASISKNAQKLRDAYRAKALAAAKPSRLSDPVKKALPTCKPRPKSNEPSRGGYGGRSRAFVPWCS